MGGAGLRGGAESPRRVPAAPRPRLSVLSRAYNVLAGSTLLRCVASSAPSRMSSQSCTRRFASCGESWRR
jgi:hypothetical protein